jgi:hypothetical protein
MRGAGKRFHANDDHSRRPTYHDLVAATTSIEKQDAEDKKNLTSVRQR